MKRVVVNHLVHIWYDPNEQTDFENRVLSRLEQIKLSANSSILNLFIFVDVPIYSDFDIKEKNFIYLYNCLIDFMSTQTICSHLPALKSVSLKDFHKNTPKEVLKYLYSNYSNQAKTIRKPIPSLQAIMDRWYIPVCFEDCETDEVKAQVHEYEDYCHKFLDEFFYVSLKHLWKIYSNKNIFKLSALEQSNLNFYTPRYSVIKKHLLELFNQDAVFYNYMYWDDMLFDATLKDFVNSNINVIWKDVYKLYRCIRLMKNYRYTRLASRLKSILVSKWISDLASVHHIISWEYRWHCVLNYANIIKQFANISESKMLLDKSISLEK